MAQMPRKLTIVTVGYRNIGFVDNKDAMEFYSLLHKGVCLERTYSIPEPMKHIQYCLADDGDTTLMSVHVSVVSLDKTQEELKEMLKPQPDLNGDLREVATPLDLPSPEPDPVVDRHQDAEDVDFI